MGEREMTRQEIITALEFCIRGERFPRAARAVEVARQANTAEAIG